MQLEDEGALQFCLRVALLSPALCTPIRLRGEGQELFILRPSVL